MAIDEVQEYYFAHCIFLTGFKLLDAQKHELFGPTDYKGKNSKNALYYDKIPIILDMGPRMHNPMFDHPMIIK